MLTGASLIPVCSLGPVPLEDRLERVWMKPQDSNMAFWADWGSSGA